MAADRSAHSYRHPKTGEWAHFLLATPQVDSWKTYLNPVWDDLGRMPHGTIRVVEIGFGRGFNIGTLLQRWQESGRSQHLEIHAFEPHPEVLRPWPQCPPELSQWMPWWGQDYHLHEGWAGAKDSWSLKIHTTESQKEHAWMGFGPVDLFLLDLFSPGKHPEQWRPPLFELMNAHAHRNSVLTTYSCARSVRESLEDSGWSARVLKDPDWRDTLVAYFGATMSTGIG